MPLLSSWLQALALGVCAVPVMAAGVTGPTGPVGPVGPLGPAGEASKTAPGPQATPRPSVAVRPAKPTPPTLPAPGAAGNRIEVTGNTAHSIQPCGAANVNTVDVRGAALQGRTVIVQGRNAQDVRSGDCGANEASSGGAGSERATSVNSVRIR